MRARIVPVGALALLAATTPAAAHAFEFVAHGVWNGVPGAPFFTLTLEYPDVAHLHWCEAPGVNGPLSGEAIVPLASWAWWIAEFPLVGGHHGFEVESEARGPLGPALWWSHEYEFDYYMGWGHYAPEGGVPAALESRYDLPHACVATPPS